jgi:hypothetical protein
VSYVTTEIKKYRAAIFPQEGTPAKISLWNGMGQQFAVLFLRPDGESLQDSRRVPYPVIDFNAQVAC